MAKPAVSGGRRSAWVCTPLGPGARVRSPAAHAPGAALASAFRPCPGEPGPLAELRLTWFVSPPLSSLLSSGPIGCCLCAPVPSTGSERLSFWSSGVTVVHMQIRRSPKGTGPLSSSRTEQESGSRGSAHGLPALAPSWAPVDSAWFGEWRPRRGPVHRSVHLPTLPLCPWLRPRPLPCRARPVLRAGRGSAGPTPACRLTCSAPSRKASCWARSPRAAASPPRTCPSPARRGQGSLAAAPPRWRRPPSLGPVSCSFSTTVPGRRCSAGL